MHIKLIKPILRSDFFACLATHYSLQFLFVVIHFPLALYTWLKLKYTI